MPHGLQVDKIRFGVFEADLRAGELRKHGVRIHLQRQPFKILAALIERPGEVVTREDLRQLIWGPETVVDFDHSLGTAINRLREALSDSADRPQFIETLAKRGFRFIAHVEPIGAPLVQAPDKDAAPIPSPADAPPIAAPAPVPVETPRRWKLALSAFAAVAVVASS
jgi:DNA-binding winged helix-turn-helix (wHTH) protein